MDQFADGAILGRSVDHKLIEGNQFAVFLPPVLPFLAFVEFGVVRLDDIARNVVEWVIVGELAAHELGHRLLMLPN